MSFLSELLQAVLLAMASVIASSLAAFLVAKAAREWQKFKATNPDYSYVIEEAASLAVKAAEQLGMAGKLEDKKTYAIDAAERFLKAKGLSIDLDIIADAIEAAVFEELNKFRASGQG